MVHSDRPKHAYLSCDCVGTTWLKRERNTRVQIGPGDRYWWLVLVATRRSRASLRCGNGEITQRREPRWRSEDQKMIRTDDVTLSELQDMVWGHTRTVSPDLRNHNLDEALPVDCPKLAPVATSLTMSQWFPTHLRVESVGADVLKKFVLQVLLDRTFTF